MLFCSYIFVLLFLPLSAAGYFLFNKLGRIYGRLFLLLCSLFFYGYFNPVYLLLLLGSLCFNYCIGSLLWKKQSRLLLFIGITVNIILLGYCKYYDFFVSNINALFNTDFTLKHLLLPLGISFFTFQQISYLCDVFNRELAEKYSPLTYSLFVTFFPQLVAGPIVLANEMMPQFSCSENARFNSVNASCGIFVFSLGLAKKMLLADVFAPMADAAFALAAPGFADSLTGVLAYALQIYFDFSGYCDMAIGIGLIYNIKLPVNFSSPYRAANIQDFWRTWHVTLGRFLSQFIYIPLGGSKKGKVRTYFNLAVTFLVSGLWHGASWMMILWGALHGAAIVIHRIWSRELKLKMPRMAAVILTFVFVCFAWIFFRAANLGEARRIIYGFSDFSSGRFADFCKHFKAEQLIYFAVAFGIIFCLPPANSFSKNFKPAFWNFALALILVICSVFSFNKISPFIYFNF